MNFLAACAIWGGVIASAAVLSLLWALHKHVKRRRTLVIGERRVVVNDATGLDHEPMGWVGREFIIVGYGEYDGWDAEVRWLDGKGSNGELKDCDDIRRAWLAENTEPVQ